MSHLVYPRETDGFLDGRPPSARAGEPVADDPQRLDLQAGVVLADADGDDAQVMGHYRTIVADPPWQQDGGPQFTSGTRKSRRGYIRETPLSRPLPYPTMTAEAIAALPVVRLAAKDAHLYLWVTNRYIEQGYAIARAWGFRPVVLLTWAKAPRGIGMGGTFVQTTEYVLFARRGTLSAQRRVDTTWFQWTRQDAAHSRKPDAFLDLVESVSPGPRLELFARRQRLGWETWGDEALEHAELAV